jgi:hypothetical protein
LLGFICLPTPQTFPALLVQILLSSAWIVEFLLICWLLSPFVFSLSLQVYIFLSIFHCCYFCVDI